MSLPPLRQAGATAPVVDTNPNDVKDIVKEETAPKPQEMAALPMPKPEITPPPKPAEPKPAEQKAEEPPPQSQEPAEIAVPQNVRAPECAPAAAGTEARAAKARGPETG